MDWFSWLSKTNLEPCLTYEYGRILVHNELQFDDISYFNHEFLQSMGIQVAKHRLEILKLAKKEIGARPRSFSGLILAINKTTRRFGKYVSRWVSRDDLAIESIPEKSHLRQPCGGGGSLIWKQRSEVEPKECKPMLKTKKIARSGPLDRRVHEKLGLTNKSLKLSGPLDCRMQEKKIFYIKTPIVSGPKDQLRLTGRSPILSGPLSVRAPSPNTCSQCQNEEMDGKYEDHSVWVTMFHDMKPT